MTEHWNHWKAVHIVRTVIPNQHTGAELKLIEHKLIKPYTPRHNGKVERSHRKDNEYFYAVHTFYSFDDFKKQLAVHNMNYNNFPMRPLNWNPPADCVKSSLTDGEVFWNLCNASLTNQHEKNIFWYSTVGLGKRILRFLWKLVKLSALLSLLYSG